MNQSLPKPLPETRIKNPLEAQFLAEAEDLHHPSMEVTMRAGSILRKAVEIKGQPEDAIRLFVDERGKEGKAPLPSDNAAIDMIRNDYPSGSYARDDVITADAELYEQEARNKKASIEDLHKNARIKHAEFVNRKPVIKELYNSSEK